MYTWLQLWSDFEIISANSFCTQREGEFRINEHVFHLKAGDAFLIPAGKITYYEASKTNPWSYAWISFIGISSESYLYQIMTSTEDIYVIHGLDTRKYYDSISRIMQLDASLTSHYFEGNSILLHIISMLFPMLIFMKQTQINCQLSMKLNFTLTSIMLRI